MSDQCDDMSDRAIQYRACSSGRHKWVRLPKEFTGDGFKRCEYCGKTEYTGGYK